MIYQIKSFTFYFTQFLLWHPSCWELEQLLYNVHKQSWKYLFVSRVGDLDPPLVDSSSLRTLWSTWISSGSGSALLSLDWWQRIPKLCPGGVQKRRFWGSHCKEGSVALLKITLRWIWAEVLQLCPALVNLSLQPQAERVWEKISTAVEGCRLFPHEERSFSGTNDCVLIQLIHTTCPNPQNVMLKW